MTKQSTVYAIALFAGLCAAAISFFAPFFPYGEDSASYLEQARSFMARGVFEVTPWETDMADVVSIPDPLFPPGYPLLIVIGSIYFATTRRGYCSLFKPCGADSFTHSHRLFISSSLGLIARSLDRHTGSIDPGCGKTRLHCF